MTKPRAIARRLLPVKSGSWGSFGVVGACPHRARRDIGTADRRGTEGSIHVQSDTKGQRPAADKVKACDRQIAGRVCGETAKKCRGPVGLARGSDVTLSAKPVGRINTGQDRELRWSNQGTAHLKHSSSLSRRIGKHHGATMPTSCP